MIKEANLHGWEIHQSASHGFIIFREVNYEEEYHDDPETAYEVIKALGKPDSYDVRVYARCKFKNGDGHGGIVKDMSDASREKVIEFVEDYTRENKDS